LGALQRIRHSRQQQEEVPEKEAGLRNEWSQTKQYLITSHLSGAVPSTSKEALSNLIDELGSRLGELTERDLLLSGIQQSCLQGRRLSATDKSALEAWLSNAKRINAAIRHLRLTSLEERHIRDAYLVWAERQPLSDLATQEVFAEQVAYVVFVRLLLARILEDKHLLKERIASDGGFAAWRDVVARYFGANGGKIHTDAFMSLLSEGLSRYYHHFFQQPVFDWFVPDDFILLETLEFLARYNFQNVSSDLLGFTYEEYIERIARNRKGHFLTQPDVVDYILDQADYQGTHIIGQRFLDPACGSGSFIVHGIRRYRDAVITALCGRYQITPEEAFGQTETREELARHTVDAAVNLFYGMDIDPFPCYLAELNILIQILEDMHYLWEIGKGFPIERFHIYNTDSLELPHSVLNSNSAAIGQSDFSHSPADEIVDESFPVKAKTGEYGPGFNFVITNPPYINPRQQLLGIDYREYPFFDEALAGVTNTYILFLRLGMHYVAQGGLLCFIVPLTVLGDSSAKAIRIMLNAHGFAPTSLTRFYTGNVLFRGIDQATAVVAAARREVSEISVAGGMSVPQARTSQQNLASAGILSAARSSMSWRPWLVSADVRAYQLWHTVKSALNEMGDLIERIFGDQVRQGDVNATHANPLRLRTHSGSMSLDIELYKGESIVRFAPLSSDPSDTLRARTSDSNLPQNSRRVNRELLRIANLSTPEHGLVIREVGRLNTRYQLVSTRFTRSSSHRLAFDHSLWRFIVRPATTDEQLDAFLALICSRVTSYLLNLFSTNNHVALEEIRTLPVPALEDFPESKLATLSKQCLSLREYMQDKFCDPYGAALPERGRSLHLSSEEVLTKSPFSKVSLNDASLRGIVRIDPDSNPNRTLGTLIRQNKITFHGSDDFEKAAKLLFESRSDTKWNEALTNLSLPEPNVASNWLASYQKLITDLEGSWQQFLDAQSQIDDVVCEWYGFDELARQAIKEGLPWAARPDQ
jgi:hypothetical protein